MKTNRCQFCDSPEVTRGRYIGVAFMILLFLTLGGVLLGFPWLAVTVTCRACGVQYIAG